MKRVLNSLILAFLAVLIAAPLAAQEEKKAKKKAQRGNQEVIAQQLAAQLEKANLTDEQKKKIDEIRAKYSEKVLAIRKELGAIMTRERRQAEKAAREKAKAEGKKGAELEAAVTAALNLNEEEKKTREEAQAKMKTVQGEIRAEVLAVLTDEQKQAAGLNKQNKKKKQKNA
jgi:hypothetical protein